MTEGTIIKVLRRSIPDFYKIAFNINLNQTQIDLIKNPNLPELHPSTIRKLGISYIEKLEGDQFDVREIKP